MTGNGSLIKSYWDTPHPTPSSLSTKPINANSGTHMTLGKKQTNSKKTKVNKYPHYHMIEYTQVFLDIV